MKAVMYALLAGICAGISAFLYDMPTADISFEEQPSEIIYWNGAPPHWN